MDLELDKIEVGDCSHIMKQWPDNTAQTVITSPPYWGLRDYGVARQIGLESTPQEYLAEIVNIFREVRRILKDDGTLWLNMGDSYSSGVSTGLKPKDLVGMPWRVAFALQADGWYLRSDIIWAKPNPMPESVTDRPTRAHEYLFLLSKSEQYFYDAAAIKEPAIYRIDEQCFYKSPSANGKYKIPSGWDTSQGGHDKKIGRYTPIPDGQARIRAVRDKQRGHGRRHAGFNDRWDQLGRDEQCSGMRNKRSVWTVAPSPFPAAHFATFPPDLIKPCILAGSRPNDIVLDPFMGAGTTALVALGYGRRFLGCELNPAYVEIAEKRIALERSQIKMVLA